MKQNNTNLILIKGIKVPSIGLGTWQLNGSAGKKTITEALSMGYRHIDTAEMYGNEQVVGEAVKDSGVAREDIFITTKVWRTNLEPKQARKSVEQSLRKLDMDYVDLLLIHWPNEAVPLEKTLHELFLLKKEGKTKQVGVSNFPVALLEKALKVGDIFCDQVEYNPFVSQQKLLHYMKDKDILFTAYSPLSRGMGIGNNVLKQISEKYNKTNAQIALRWLIQQKNVAAIPKAASMEHLKQNLDIFDFQLTEDEMQQVTGIAL